MKARIGSLGSLASAAVLAVGTSGAWAQAPTPPAPVTASQAAATASKSAATVNGEAITEGEVEPVVQMVIKERFKLQPPSDAQRREVRMEVVGMIADDVLMRQFLAKSAIKVEPAEVDKQLGLIEANLKKDTPPRSLADFLRESNQTEAQLRLSITNMLRWANYVKSRITEPEVRKYYDDNKDFFDQVQVKASHILFRVSANAGEPERHEAMQKLAALRADIVANKIDFAEAAKKFSQCPSAPNGGDMGFFSRKMMLPEPFAKAAFALQPNQISDIVQTEIGVHIIKVTDRKRGEPSDYEKIKDDVRDFYVEEMRQGLLAQERRAAKIDIAP